MYIKQFLHKNLLFIDSLQGSLNLSILFVLSEARLKELLVQSISCKKSGRGSVTVHVMYAAIYLFIHLFCTI